MAKTRYMLMSDSLDQVTDKGIKRVDIFSFPINDFSPQDVLLDWTLSESDVFRFDLFIMSHYGTVDYYLEMIKWLNGLFGMDESKVGTVIKLYSKRDLDRFLRDNLIKLDRG